MAGRIEYRADYRAFVDGLRAMAIIAVVGYHIGLPGFGGGFVGVDVFFVISGFLIIGQIVNQISSGRFSLIEFYARRVLRLLPLLLFVLVATYIAAIYLLATPDDYRGFGGSAVAAATMRSNDFFLAAQGYFDAAADTKPLLHTWSLSVEGQFYIFAPLLIWLAYVPFGATGGKFLVAAGIVAAAASLVGCILATDATQNAAFFLTPYRAWEFLAGAAAIPLARTARRLPSWLLHLIGISGLVSIAICVATYSSAMLYPSWYPVVPVIGAALAIIAGEADEGTIGRRILAFNPIVGIGIVSYGWYLWHWPLLTFGRIYHFGEHRLGFDIFTGGIISFLLAVLTYFLVERPVARWKQEILQRGKRMTVAVGIAACFLVALPGEIFENGGAQYVEKSLTASTWPPKTSLDSISDDCIIRDRDWTFSSACKLSEQRSGILVGDSHAREFYVVLKDRAQQAGVSLVTLVQAGCPPLFDTEVEYQGQLQTCHRGWEAAYRSLINARASLEFAVIQSSFSIFIGGENGDRPKRLLADPDGAGAYPDQYAALESKLTETIKSLQKLNVRRVLIIAPEPQFNRDAPECLLRAKKMGVEVDFCGRPLAEIQDQHQKTLHALQKVAAQFPEARVIDPFSLVCDQKFCRQHRDAVPLYIDDNHFSRRANEMLYQAFNRDFAWVFENGTASLE